MCDILGVSEYAPYDLRVEALKVNGIALWDVLRSCRREGSLDSAIDETTEVANEFAAFFRKHPKITHVFFNGGKAERSFNKHVIGTLGENARKLTLLQIAIDESGKRVMGFGPKTQGLGRNRSP